MPFLHTHTQCRNNINTATNSSSKEKIWEFWNAHTCARSIDVYKVKFSNWFFSLYPRRQWKEVTGLSIDLISWFPTLPQSTAWFVPVVHYHNFFPHLWNNNKKRMQCCAAVDKYDWLSNSSSSLHSYPYHIRPRQTIGLTQDCCGGEKVGGEEAAQHLRHIDAVLE